jgi:NAD(P)-dependent dehydrogenase (short-subunit alcohol dehydrogenase family)
VDLGLTGKVAIVTGAGSQIGFGKGIAMTLAKEGCDIVVTDINLEGAQQTAADVKALGRKAMAFKTDVTKSSEVQAMVDAVIKEFGKIDILINNAGVGTKPVPFVDSTEAEWDTNININLKGTMICTKAVLSNMIARKSGKIVSMSSTAGVSGMRTGGVYGAAKGGMIIWTQALAQELADSNININCLAPGLGATGFHKASNFPPEYNERVLKPALAAGRTTTPQDIGNAMAFLVSDVSQKITGQCIKVSGAM